MDTNRGHGTGRDPCVIHEGPGSPASVDVSSSWVGLPPLLVLPETLGYLTGGPLVCSSIFSGRDFFDQDGGKRPTSVGSRVSDGELKLDPVI